MKIDKDGLILCELQGNIFEESNDRVECSSEIFIRRFIYSSIVKEFDSKSILDNSITKEEVFEIINNEFGETNYGKIKYSKEILFWIGYIYRYMVCTLNLSSKQIYKIIKPKELNELYYIYHTFDCEQAIERILENKNLVLDSKGLNERLFRLLRKRKNEKLIDLVDNKTLYPFNKDNSVLKEENRDKQLIIVFNDEIIGEVRFENIFDKAYNLIIIINNEKEYVQKELDIIVLEKILKYAKNEFKDGRLEKRIDKGCNREIDLYKEYGFEYDYEDDNSIYYYIKINDMN